MDVNGLRISDEFRMRSPVVWLCFGIVVLCALSAESGIQRSYHLIHGQTGPILRNVLPTTGFVNVGPQIMGQIQSAQRQDTPEEEDDEDDSEEDEEYDEYDPGYGHHHGGGDPSSYPYPHYEDEEEEDEEEEDEEEEEEEELGVVTRVDDNIEGRQAYVNNQFVDQPHGSKQNNKVKQYNNNNFNNNNKAPGNNNNRVPVNNNRQQFQGNRPNNNRPNNNINNNFNNNAPNRRKPNPGPNQVRPGQVAFQNNNRVQPGNWQQQANRNPQRNQQLNKQRLQLSPVATSTQFIATPVADLILRLSISLAKPVGNRNATNFNVPIRIQHDAVKDVVAPNLISLGLNRADDELPKTEKTPIVAELSDKQHVEEADEEEEEPVEKEEASAVPVTELPRK